LSGRRLVPGVDVGRQRDRPQRSSRYVESMRPTFLDTSDLQKCPRETAKSLSHLSTRPSRARSSLRLPSLVD
jgi:hypothetical protein